MFRVTEPAGDKPVSDGYGRQGGGARCEGQREEDVEETDGEMPGDRKYVAMEDAVPKWVDGFRLWTSTGDVVTLWR